MPFVRFACRLLPAKRKFDVVAAEAAAAAADGCIDDSGLPQWFLIEIDFSLDCIVIDCSISNDAAPFTSLNVVKFDAIAFRFSTDSKSFDGLSVRS